MSPTGPDPPASDFDQSGQSPPEPLLTPWSLRVQAPPEIRQELLARILSARPWWEAQSTETGLEVTFDLKEGPPEPSPAIKAPNEPVEAPPSLDTHIYPNLDLEGLPGPNAAVYGASFEPTSDDPIEGGPQAPSDETIEGGHQTPLALVQSLLELLSRGRPLETKVSLKWQPPWRPQREALTSLGLFKIQEISQPLAPSLLPSARVILSPQAIRLKPRLKAWTETAAQALVSHFSPPLGAPSTKGHRALIIDENPALLSLLTLFLGAGEVELVCSQPFMADQAQKLGQLNNLADKLKITLAGPPPLPKAIEQNWLGRFELIVINLSPYLTVKYLKKINSFFESTRGRLIISGLRRGGQISFVLKAATRYGLALIESAAEDDEWATLTLAKGRFLEVPVQKWKPGDWVSQLSQDELDILDEIDRFEAAPGHLAESGPLSED